MIPFSSIIGIEKLRSRRVVLAPYNNISLQLLAELKNQEPLVRVIGVADKRSAAGVIEYPSDSASADVLIVCSPNHYKGIVKSNRSAGLKICFGIKIGTRWYVCKELCYRLLLFIYSAFQYLKPKHFGYVLYRLKLFSARLHPLFQNERKLASLSNCHLGARAFIIGNGPSLSVDDLEHLADEITFAANKIYLAYPKTGFRPTYYFVEDHLVYEQNQDEISALACAQKFFPVSLLKNSDGIPPGLIYRSSHSDSPTLNGKPIEPIRGLTWGSTVVYTMAQMAIYMGVTEIYLIGIDFHFTYEADSVSAEKHIISSGESNHFHSEYRQPGERWHVPNLEFQKEAFLSLAEECDQRNITIMNLSRKTKLDIFERSTLEAIKYGGA